MPKVNVYLPDDLAEAVRETGIPVSAICQGALDQAIKQVQAVRRAVAIDLRAPDQPVELGHFTARTVKAIELAVARSFGLVTTGDLLAGIIAEGGNLAVQILTSMDVPVTTLTVPDSPAETGTGPGLRFSRQAAAVLEAAVVEAIALGHNYVGTEHLLIALAATPTGQAAKALAAAGAEAKPVRRAVISALAGYAHLRSTTPTAGLKAALRQELQPLIDRIERLEGIQDRN